MYEIKHVIVQTGTKYNKDLDDALEDGWEPFSVISRDDIGIYYREVWLRRENISLSTVAWADR